MSNQRLNNAVENAELAFWAEIAKSFPEVKTGDLGPDVSIPLTEMMKHAVSEWLKLNAPEGMSAAHEDQSATNGSASGFPSQSGVDAIKEKYPVGTRIRLEHMPNDPDPIPYGTQGVVQDVDDAGQLVMKCDNGRTLSLIPGVDQFGVVKLSFEDFVATKKWSDDIEKDIGFDNGAGKMKGYIYRECLYIEQLDDGTYFLPIERDEFSSDKLEELEKTLYDRHFGLVGY